MANTLSIAPRAEADLKEAFAWYEARSAGLGHEFLRCVEARLNLIARAPQLFRERGPLTAWRRPTAFPTPSTLSGKNPRRMSPFAACCISRRINKAWRDL